MSEPSRRTCLLVAALYGLLTVVLLAPTLFSSTPAYLGHPFSDLWKHVWGHWWVGESLRASLAWPLATKLQNFPWGGTLFVIDPLNAAVCGVFPGPAAFNALVVAQLTLGAWGAWRLARHVTGDSAASLVAGAVFAFSPWVLSYSVSSGVSETLGLGWIPLAAWGLLRTLEARGFASAVGTGCALLMAGLNSWYYLLFSGILCAFLVAASLLAGRPETWLPRPAPGLPRRLAVIALVAAVGLFPLARVFVASFSPETSLEPDVGQRLAFTTALEGQLDFFTVSDFVTPGKDRLRVRDVLERLHQTPYLGWLALLLAALGLWRGGAQVRAWGVAALVFFLLSLGPAVSFTPMLRSSQPVNATFMTLYPLLGFWLITAPFRVHLLTVLCTAVLAAVGLSGLLRIHRGLLGVLATTAVLAEVCWISPAPFPIPAAAAAPPALIRDLRLNDRVGAEGHSPGVRPSIGVLDIPAVRYESELTPSEYYYYQTFHHAGIPYSTGGIVERSLRENGFFLEMWRLAVGIYPPATDPLSAGRGLDDLARLGFRHVLLHTGALPPPRADYARRVLERWLGPPVAEERGIVHFRLAAP